MLRQTVGVNSFSGAIELLSKDDCSDVDEKVLIKHLCEQFKATPATVMRFIEEAVKIGIIARVYMGNDYYVIRMEKRTHESVLEDIKNNPENHRHDDLNDLTNCCIIGNAVDMSLMEAHAKFVDMGSNGGKKCDVWTGHCACGGWHFINKDGNRT